MMKEKPTVAFILTMIGGGINFACGANLISEGICNRSVLFRTDA
jgi:hypothetical protein